MHGRVLVGRIAQDGDPSSPELLSRLQREVPPDFGVDALCCFFEECGVWNVE